MQNVKVVKTVSFVLGACTITWMPTLVLLLVNFYNFKANWLCVTMGKLDIIYGLGLGKSLLLHQTIGLVPVILVNS